jgi:hypothetical protein
LFNFFNQLDSTLQYLYNIKIEFIICGGLNLEFSKDSKFKLLLSRLLQSYNLFHSVDFPPRFSKTTCFTIDNIFIDNFRVNLFKVSPIINGLSDHNTQYLNSNNALLD